MLIIPKCKLLIIDIRLLPLQKPKTNICLIFHEYDRRTGATKGRETKWYQKKQLIGSKSVT